MSVNKNLFFFHGRFVNGVRLHLHTQRRPRHMTLGQAQQCGRVKAANGIPTFPSCSTTIINMILRDLFPCRWRRTPFTKRPWKKNRFLLTDILLICTFCWYCWNCWRSLLKRSFLNIPFIFTMHNLFSWKSYGCLCTWPFFSTSYFLVRQ
jgi:hypothetical protein